MEVEMERALIIIGAIVMIAGGFSFIASAGTPLPGVEWWQPLAQAVVSAIFARAGYKLYRASGGESFFSSSTQRREG